jgi:hypothetical protein
MRQSGPLSLQHGSLALVSFALPLHRQLADLGVELATSASRLASLPVPPEKAAAARSSSYFFQA